MNEIFIREIRECEKTDAVALVWKVFFQFEAPDYTSEGVVEFQKTLHDEEYLQELHLYGAFLHHEPVGVLATKNRGAHIALFFVKENYQRRGIGRRLFEAARADCTVEKMTVNSSPYAVPVYQRLGFRATHPERTVNGLRFTPMECIFCENEHGDRG